MRQRLPGLLRLPAKLLLRQRQKRFGVGAQRIGCGAFEGRIQIGLHPLVLLLFAFQCLAHGGQFFRLGTQLGHLRLVGDHLVQQAGLARFSQPALLCHGLFALGPRRRSDMVSAGHSPNPKTPTATSASATARATMASFLFAKYTPCNRAFSGKSRPQVAAAGGVRRDSRSIPYALLPIPCFFNRFPHGHGFTHPSPCPLDLKFRGHAHILLRGGCHPPAAGRYCRLAGAGADAKLPEVIFQ